MLSILVYLYIIKIISMAESLRWLLYTDSTPWTAYMKINPSNDSISRAISHPQQDFKKKTAKKYHV